MTHSIKRYATIFIVLLVTETAIAIFHFHTFIRGFIGDVLVVPLLYCFFKIICNWNVKKTLIVVLSIAFITEILQAGNWLHPLTNDNALLKILLGSTFDVYDLMAYTCGILPVLAIELYIQKH